MTLATKTTVVRRHACGEDGVPLAYTRSSIQTQGGKVTALVLLRGTTVK